QLHLLFFNRNHRCLQSPRRRGSAFQATLEVQPADKRLPLVFRIGLVIGSLLIERFDSEEACNLLSRKTHLLELPNVRHRWKRLSEFHGHPPVSLSRQVMCLTTAKACIKLKYLYLAIHRCYWFDTLYVFIAVQIVNDYKKFVKCFGYEFESLV